MGWWSTVAAEDLWRHALAAIPLSLMIAVICRWLPGRPLTRHTLWLVVLLWLAVGPALPGFAPGDDDPRPTILVTSETEFIRPLPSDAASSITEPVADKHRGVESFERRSPMPTDDSTSVASSPTTRPRNVPAIDGTYRTRSTPELNRPGTAPVLPIDASDAGVAESSPHHGEQVTAGSPARQPLPDGRGSERSAPSSGRVLAGGPLPEGRGSERGAIHDGCGTEERPLPYGRGSERNAPSDGGGDRTARALPSANESVVDETESGDLRIGVVATAAPGDGSEWRSWMVGLVRVRDAIGRLPAFPVEIWLIGVAVLACLCGLRLFVDAWQMRGSMPADRGVLMEVAFAAVTVGLRRPPEVVMVRRRCSPMIACGLRCRLVLPIGLWTELDARGRRAVLLHELAHLARRDHWVCRLSLVVCVLYWWHPVAWWVRHRLGEEADHCCDAWVTWLLPRARRAYAEALLATRSYLSGGAVAAPAMSMGVLSGRGRRFARRLTGVMTQSSSPRHSLVDAAVGCAVVAVCWLATPAASRANDQAEDLPADGPPIVEAAPESAVAPTAVESAPMSAVARMARLERQIASMTEQISTITNALAVMQGVAAGGVNDTTAAEGIPGAEGARKGSRTSTSAVPAVPGTATGQDDRLAALMNSVSQLNGALLEEAAAQDARAAEFEETADQFHVEASRIREQADALAHDAESLRQSAGELYRRVADAFVDLTVDGATVHDPGETARTLAERARLLEGQAIAANARAVTLEQQAEWIGDQARYFETSATGFRERAGAIRDRVESLSDALAVR